MSANGPLPQFVRRRPAALDVLHLRDFRYYLLGNATGDLSFQLNSIAANWIVLQLTDSPFWVGLVSGIQVVPQLSLALLGGALADRLDRRRVLALSRGAFTGLSFATAYLVSTGRVSAWYFLMLAFLVGTASSFGGPARQALVFDLAGKARVFAANALNGLISNVASMIGPALAGYLIGSFSTSGVFLLAGAIYILSVLLVAVIRSGPPTVLLRGNSVAGDMLAGLAYIRRTPCLLALLLVALTALPGGFVMPLIPVYARDILQAGSTGYGILSSMLGAGLLVGSIAATMVRDLPRKALVLIGAQIAWDVGTLIFAFSHNFALSAGVLFIMGIFGHLWFNLMMTMFHLYTEDEMRGRVMGLSSIAMATFNLGFIVGGALASVTTTWFPLVLGATLGTPVAALIILRSPELRRA